MEHQNQRPAYYSSEVLELTLDKLMPKIIKYLASEDPEIVNDEEYVSQIRKSISQAIDYEDERFQICKSLDQDSWTIDSALEDIIDDVPRFRDDAYDIVIKKWIEINSIVAKKCIGDIVRFNNTRDTSKLVTGEIIKIDEKRAKYLVFSAELGHVKKGCGTLGNYITFEELEALNP
jgi:hypothetical protein